MFVSTRSEIINFSKSKLNSNDSSIICSPSLKSSDYKINNQSIEDAEKVFVLSGYILKVNFKCEGLTVKDIFYGNLTFYSKSGRTEEISISKGIIKGVIN
jgi:hypothetical protein